MVLSFVYNLLTALMEISVAVVMVGFLHMTKFWKKMDFFHIKALENASEQATQLS